MNESKFVIIPGWNDYVKEFHKTARYHFLLWKDNGRPLLGRLYEDMKTSRSKFKNALDECKRNERDIRNMKLLENFKNKDMEKFWCEVTNAKKHNLPTPQNIDGRCEPVDVCNLFSEIYRIFF